MEFRKIEDEIQGCVFKKIDNRKICHDENLENRKRESEIYSKNIPKDRRLERLQISERLKRKLEDKRKKENP